jgi:hypothetical protein
MTTRSVREEDEYRAMLNGKVPCKGPFCDNFVEKGEIYCYFCWERIKR